jgi:hypothetical protein
MVTLVRGSPAGACGRLVAQAAMMVVRRQAYQVFPAYRPSW